MNKQELVAAVAESTERTKADAAEVVDAVFKAISEALGKGEEVRLIDFVTLSVVERAASEGRDPRTGKPIKIAASKRVKLKVGKGLKDLINGRKSKPAAKKKKTTA